MTAKRFDTDGACSSLSWSAGEKRARRILFPWAILHGNMWATSTRQDKRKACVAGILMLAGVLLFQRTISLNGQIISSELSGNDHSSSNNGAATEACQWSAGMPELYVLKHSRGHPKGENERRS